MAALPMAWTLWTLLSVSLWTTASTQLLLQESVTNLYPKLSDQATVECDCGNTSCDSVYWFRTVPTDNSLTFLAKYNNADRVFPGSSGENKRIKLSKRGSSFVLRILAVREDDRGIYSCVIKDKANKDMWRPGSFLQPGVTPPTPPPLTKPPPVKNGCRCPKKRKPSRDDSGCDSLLLWPLVGLAVALSVTLICTLYYYSRLPKKCYHHFGKVRQMS